DQDEVGVVVGERRIAGDEPGMTAHDLHDPDAADGGLDLNTCGLDRLGGLGERGGEAEALPDVRDVVVDRLGHADDADRQAACGDLGADVGGAAHRSIPPDNHGDVD